MEVKGILLNMAEDNVKLIIKEILIPGAAEFVKDSENSWDDTVLPFLPQLQEFLLKNADKIDGVEG